MRRIILALTVSIAVHLAVLAVAVGVGLWRTMSLVPALKMQSIAVDVVKELPLGPLPSKEGEPPAPKAPPRARKPKAKVAAAHQGVTVAATPDAGAAPEKRDAGSVSSGRHRDAGPPVDGGRRRPGDLRKGGPEGSRLVALLRLDRLRASPENEATVAALDQLLSLLPDRHWLIDGTGFDLYRDFDSLVIATPNPADATVTFLAVRHHLTDAALKDGLDRGAKAMRKAVSWRNLDGRPVGIRQTSKTESSSWLERDDRILVLPQPSLAIVAPPAYASLLLGTDPTPPKNPSGPPDAGPSDGPLVRVQPAPHVPWSEIAARIDEQEGALPDDAVFMMEATQLFKSSASTAGLVVPPSRGASDDSPMQAVGGSPMPEEITLLAGVQTPFLELMARFATAAEAERWERDIPSWKRRLLTNPIVLLSGFSQLVGRCEVSREEETLSLRASASTDELRRLLNLAANLTRAAMAARSR